jgi:tetratricopeptide (TPR) repeat protein
MAFREAIAVYQSVEAMDSVAAARCSLANALYLSGDLRSALAEVQLAQDVYAGLEPNHLVLGRSCLLGGTISGASGCHEAARRCFEQALSFMTGRDVLGAGETYAALGFQAARQGEWEEARGALQRALDILDGVHDSHILSIIVRELSEACYQCGDPVCAAEMARRAGSLSASVGDQNGVAWAAVRLAEIALPAGDAETARAAVEEARLLLQASCDSKSEPPPAGTPAGPEAQEAAAESRLLFARILRVESRLLRRDGDIEGALVKLKDASVWLEAGAPEPGLFVALCREAATQLRELGRVDEAISYYERALGVVERAQPKDPGGALAPLQLARMPSPLWFRA